MYSTGPQQAAMEWTDRSYNLNSEYYWRSERNICVAVRDSAVKCLLQSEVATGQQNNTNLLNQIYVGQCTPSSYQLRAIGSSVGVEQPSVAMPEAAQRPIVFPHKARNFFPIIQLSYQEIALVASRYIEGRALTSCSSTPSLSIQAEIKHTAIFLEFERYSDRNTRVQSSKATRKKKIGTKSGAAQAAPAAPLSMALQLQVWMITGGLLGL